MGNESVLQMAVADIGPIASAVDAFNPSKYIDTCAIIRSSHEFPL